MLNTADDFLQPRLNLLSSTLAAFSSHEKRKIASFQKAEINL